MSDLTEISLSPFAPPSPPPKHSSSSFFSALTGTHSQPTPPQSPHTQQATTITTITTTVSPTQSRIAQAVKQKLSRASGLFKTAPTSTSTTEELPNGQRKRALTSESMPGSPAVALVNQQKERRASCASDGRRRRRNSIFNAPNAREWRNESEPGEASGDIGECQLRSPNDNNNKWEEPKESPETVYSDAESIISEGLHELVAEHAQEQDGVNETNSEAGLDPNGQRHSLAGLQNDANDRLTLQTDSDTLAMTHLSETLSEITLDRSVVPHEPPSNEENFDMFSMEELLEMHSELISMVQGLSLKYAEMMDANDYLDLTKTDLKHKIEAYVHNFRVEGNKNKNSKSNDQSKKKDKKDTSLKGDKDWADTFSLTKSALRRMRRR